MTVFRRLQLPRAGTLDAYHAYLTSTLFPLVDHLHQRALIQGYDFLTHGDGAPRIDLRLWIRDEASIDAVAGALRQRHLPPTLDDWTPAETGTERAVLLGLLHRAGELVRALLDDSAGTRTIEELVHWLVNQYGLSNQQEVQWHERQAIAWARH